MLLYSCMSRPFCCYAAPGRGTLGSTFIARPSSIFFSSSIDAKKITAWDRWVDMKKAKPRGRHSSHLLEIDWSDIRVADTSTGWQRLAFKNL
jgi:hypothetical protein